MIMLRMTKNNHKTNNKMSWLVSVGVSTKDEDALKFLYENSEDFSPLPTFCIVPSQFVMMGGALWTNIRGWSVDLTKVLTHLH